MTRRQRGRVRSTLTIWAFTTLAATLAQLDRSPYAVTGNAIVCLVVVAIVRWFYQKLVPRMRRVPLLAASAISGFVLLLALGLAIAFWIWILAALDSGSFVTPKSSREIVRYFGSRNGGVGILYGYAIILATTFGLELSRRLGKERLSSLITGRYRNPKEEIRVFLLVDLRDSTPLAERLGSVRFSGLLRDLFRDMTDSIRETDGEVVAYVGDEAILTWTERTGFADANALRCFVGIRREIARRSESYERLYGVAPPLKCAIHLRPIVVTEFGDLRTDVAFHGDALNTATRILDECGPLRAELLLSATTAERLPPVSGVLLEPMGEVSLRGKGGLVGIVRATFGPETISP